MGFVRSKPLGSISALTPACCRLHVRLACPSCTLAWAYVGVQIRLRHPYVGTRLIDLILIGRKFRAISSLEGNLELTDLSAYSLSESRFCSKAAHHFASKITSMILSSLWPPPVSLFPCLYSRPSFTCPPRGSISVCAGGGVTHFSATVLSFLVLNW